MVTKLVRIYMFLCLCVCVWKIFKLVMWTIISVLISILTLDPTPENPMPYPIEFCKHLHAFLCKYYETEIDRSCKLIKSTYTQYELTHDELLTEINNLREIFSHVCSIELKNISLCIYCHQLPFFLLTSLLLTLFSKSNTVPAKMG